MACHRHAVAHIMTWHDTTPHHTTSTPLRDVQVVDKHFNDNWVITVYMGHVVDLSTEVVSRDVSS